MLNLILMISFLIGCHSKSRDNGGSNDGAGTARKTGNLYAASYEVTDACTTGLQKFSKTTEKELETAFCNALKDESLNKNCASFLRKQIFKTVECLGEFSLIEKEEIRSSYTQNYAISENGCGTGGHFFASSNEKSLNEIYCKGLRNDDLNNNCAKNQREERYLENKCDEVLKYE